MNVDIIYKLINGNHFFSPCLHARSKFVCNCLFESYARPNSLRYVNKFKIHNLTLSDMLWVESSTYQPMVLSST